jgi:hypothetical protein
MATTMKVYIDEREARELQKEFGDAVKIVEERGLFHFMEADSTTPSDVYKKLMAVRRQAVMDRI